VFQNTKKLRDMERSRGDKSIRKVFDNVINLGRATESQPDRRQFPLFNWRMVQHGPQGLWRTKLLRSGCGIIKCLMPD